MPLVTLHGNLFDHGGNVLPSELQQRVWLVPNRGHIKEGSMALDGLPVLCDFDRNTGRFGADVWSTLEPDLWYILRTDWLVPGQETEPPEERARGYFEWPERIFPDVGGYVGDLVKITAGVGMVYVGGEVSTGMENIPRYQFAYNPYTHWLYERQITW